MTKSKILFVIGTLEIGGAETQLVELASRLNVYDDLLNLETSPDRCRVARTS